VLIIYTHAWKLYTLYTSTRFVNTVIRWFHVRLCVCVCVCVRMLIVFICTCVFRLPFTCAHRCAIQTSCSRIKSSIRLPYIIILLSLLKCMRIYFVPVHAMTNNTLMRIHFKRFFDLHNALSSWYHPPVMVYELYNQTQR
jgi:hypothetical protein